MVDYSEICEVKILDSARDVNQLLKSYWVLLDVFHSDGTCWFVLGKLYAASECEFFDYDDDEI